MIRFFQWASITLILIFVSVFTVLFFSPKPTLLSDTDFSTAVYDTNHHLLRLTLTKDEKYRFYKHLSEISPILISSTLLQEDQYFYQHVGVNPFSLFHAVIESYIKQSRRRGGSTISMQVARLRFGMNSKKIRGKLEQIYRAFQLERHYSKNEILEAYLNLAPYGRNIEGIGAASLIYFNKEAKSINLPEALALSVIPQNPRKRIPNQASLIESRARLFTRWVKQFPQDKNQEVTINLPLQMRDLSGLPFEAEHFVNSILKNNKMQAKEVVTTLDLKLQQIITRIAKNYIKRQQAFGVYNGAVLLVDSRNMQVKALVGSADFYNNQIEGQINGTTIKRSPGSTLKPFIYGLAFDQGIIHPSSVLKDVPRSFGSYNPENFDYDFLGPVKAKDALILSRNIPALTLSSQLNDLSLYQFLELGGIRQLKPESFYGLALALGGAETSMQELVSLYAMLNNKGIWHALNFRHDEYDSTTKALLSPESSFLVLDILRQSPRPSYTKQAATIPLAYKTGTSSGFRDAWAIGNFGPYVLAVWIGNFNNKSNEAFVGKQIAAPLLFELVDAINQEINVPSLEVNPKHLHLEKVLVCKGSGMLPSRACPETEMTWFIPGKSPIQVDSIYREVAIDNKTGLRACRADNNTHFEIFEFWPTDLFNIFKQAGIQPKSPPPYQPDCFIHRGISISPQIVSPNKSLIYIIPKTQPSLTMKIPFIAVADGDVKHLYWFVNEAFITKSNPEKPFLFQASPGNYLVRVVDDHGLSDAQKLKIKLA